MKNVAPAAERNREPILQVLRTRLPEAARVLEIGSGTGQHAAHFTHSMPGWIWQPTDASEQAVQSVAAYRRESELPGFLEPRLLDVRSGIWPRGPFDAVFSANVIHISPWEVARALFEGAAQVLSSSGALFLYGPFRFDGEFTAPSNAAFDARLRSEDASWGVRDVADLRALGKEFGFSAPDIVEMPANNHVLRFARIAK